MALVCVFTSMQYCVSSCKGKNIILNVFPAVTQDEKCSFRFVLETGKILTVETA